MQLQYSRLSKVNVFNFTQVQGDNGLEITSEFLKTIEANVQPLSDKLNAEIYGERIKNMLKIITLDTVIVGQGVSFERIQSNFRKCI